MKANTTPAQPAPPLPWEPLLWPLVFIAAAILRILQLGTFVTGDELAWAFRCIKMAQAPADGSLIPVLGDLHGALTVWIGSLGLGLSRVGAELSTVPDWQTLTNPATFGAQSLAQLRLVASAWPAAKLPVAAATAMLITLLSFLTARTWGPRAGLFAGLLVALSPYHLALSRILGADALTATLTISSLVALLWGLYTCGHWAPFLLSGLLAGLAVANQNLAALLLPYGLVLLVIAHLVQRRPVLEGLGNTALWLAAAFVAALVACPATWVSPLVGAPALVAWIRQGLLPLTGLAAAFGRPPDWIALVLRLSPLTMAGLVLAALGLVINENYRRLTTLALLGWAAVFLFLAPQAEPLTAHWDLTTLITLDVLAALGFDGLPSAVRRLLRPRWPRLALWPELALSLALLAAMAWQAREVVKYHPYYPAYRNPWAAARLPARTVIGWGEGMDRAVAYLNAQPKATTALVATPDLLDLAPFYVGQAVPLSEETIATADYVVLYNRDWLQPTPLVASLAATQPREVVRLHGVEYARIYANRRHEPILGILQGQLRPEDVIVVDAPSPLGRHYQGPAPYQEIRVESPAQVTQELERLVPGRWRLWHIAFDGADPQQIVRGLLETHAVLAERHQVPGAVVSTYLLPLQPQFRPRLRSQGPAVEFQGGLSLEQAALAEAQVQYREKIGLTLEWRARSKIENNIAISLRLLDERGRQWVSQDQWIVNGNGRSTAHWVEGHASTSQHTLDLPPGIPPGPYRLKMVLYLADSLQPLPALSGVARPGATELELFALEVRPAQIPPTVAELKLKQPLGVTLADGVELLGCEILAATVQAGQDLPLKLWWRTTHPVTSTYQAHLMLLDSKGDQRGDAIVELASARHPTTNWIANEVIEGRYGLEVAAEAAAGEAILGVELVGIQGAVGKPVQAGKVRIVAPTHSFEVPAMAWPRQETLGEVVRLLGYDLEPVSLKPGQTLRLTLYWQALAPMRERYTVFTHLLDGAGEVRAGHDGVPVGGTRPTSGWVLHEVLTDRHDITVPPGTRPGAYAIEVGLYEPGSGQRLPAFDSSAVRLEQDRILLGTVVIE